MNLQAPISRRRWLKESALGFGAVAFSSLLADSARGDLKKPHFAPKAKRVIFLFMKGGPSAIDTFDPKPLLDRDHGKPFPGTRPRVTFAKTGTLLKSPWKFKYYGKCGQPVSELFPHVARHVD